MRKPTIIGFMGLAGSGKTTFSKHFVDNYGAKCVSFADPIKDACRALGVTKDTNPGAYRILAQTIGKTCRSVDRDFFVKKWSDTVTKMLRENAHSLIVVDDVRYRNEVEYIKMLGGHLIYNEAFMRMGIDLHEHPYTHESEYISVQITKNHYPELFGKGDESCMLYDVSVLNNGDMSLDDVLMVVENVVKELQKREPVSSH